MNIGDFEKLVVKRDEAEDILTMSLDLLRREVDKFSEKERDKYETA